MGENHDSTPEQRKPASLGYATPKKANWVSFGFAVIGLLLVPCLLFLSFLGFAGFVVDWQNPFADRRIPWSLLLMGIGGLAAAVWVIWRAVRTFKT